MKIQSEIRGAWGRRLDKLRRRNHKKSEESKEGKSREEKGSWGRKPRQINLAKSLRIRRMVEMIYSRDRRLSSG